MAIKASDNFKVYHNLNGPDISTLKRPIIEADGLYFKDIDGTGTVSAVNDWRLSPAERAAAYVKLLTLDEKIGQLFISDWRMGPKYPSAQLKGHVAVADESGCVDEAERIGFAVRNSGVDVISGLYDNKFGRESYDRGTNGYYDTHELPEGFTPDMVTLNDEAIDRAVTRTLTEMFTLGMFENTYRDAKKAKETVKGSQYWADAELAHRQSVVLLKNDGTLPWLVGNVEKNVDALLAGFETYPAATLDVIFGRYNPTGKLPITLPKGDEVLAVNAEGVCISPNDVPGFDKDQYMPAELKDENGKAYAYRDTNGNYYELNFGLSF